MDNTFDSDILVLLHDKPSWFRPCRPRPVDNVRSHILILFARVWTHRDVIWLLFRQHILKFLEFMNNCLISSPSPPVDRRCWFCDVRTLPQANKSNPVKLKNKYIRFFCYGRVSTEKTLLDSFHAPNLTTEKHHHCNVWGPHSLCFITTMSERSRFIYFYFTLKEKIHWSINAKDYACSGWRTQSVPGTIFRPVTDGATVEGCSTSCRQRSRPTSLS